jgi:hypothetical protein
VTGVPFDMPLPGDLVPLLPLLIGVTPLPAPLDAGVGVHAMVLAGSAVVARLPEACPEGSVLVDGELCPALEYECTRFVDDASPSCAEYAQKPECRHDARSLRFCVDRYEWPNRPGEKPRVFATWYDAREACESAGKRLCTRSEWSLACEGPKRAPYPYGWKRLPSPCNVGRPMLEVGEDRLRDPRTRAAELERLWQGDPIGSHPDCVSPFGAFDMVGNVDEWTDNSEESQEQPSTLNGGYWGPVRNTCRLTTKTHGPEFQFYQIGFRCCADTRDGILAALAPPRQSPEQLDRRRGPEGWPIVVDEEARAARIRARTEGAPVPAAAPLLATLQPR